MKACATCNHLNREGALVCEECGFVVAITAAVAAGGTTSTRQFDTQAGVEARLTWGNTHFERETAITLYIRDAVEPLVLQPTTRVILGRSDPTSIQRPDCDLAPYGALEKGVSRIHAAIYRTDETLTIVDMGSSNGTHLNGQRLVSEQPRILRDGDEVQLGKLVAHIYFKQIKAAQ